MDSFITKRFVYYFSLTRREYMDDIYFSILIPVYNVEDYLSDCIDSVLNQTYQNFEIILVDDGSTDNSGKICDEYAEKHDNISVYHKPNRGLLHTRRVTIEKAVGDWYIFLDSDDSLQPETLQVLYDKIKEYDCDCIIYKWQRVFQGKVVDNATSAKPDVVVTEKRKLYNIVFNDSAYNSLCRKACKATLFDGRDYSEFYHIKHGEDLLQSIEVLENATKTVITDYCLYNYTYNPKSITHNVNIPELERIFLPFEQVCKLLERDKVFEKEDYILLYNNRLVRFMKTINMICKMDISINEKISTFDKIKKTEFYKIFLFADKQKYFNKSVYYYLFKIFIRGHYRIILFLVKIYNILSLRR